MRDSSHIDASRVGARASRAVRSSSLCQPVAEVHPQAARLRVMPRRHRGTEALGVFSVSLGSVAASSVPRSGDLHDGLLAPRTARVGDPA